MTKKISKILSVAGFDGSGGAGIHADIKTFAALKCYGASILTSLTIQNTQGVKSVFTFPTKVVEDQFDAIFSDIDIDAVKTGMLYNKENVELVAKMLKHYKPKHVIIDPVMYCHEKSVQYENQSEIMKNTLFPLATIITPNIQEAEALTDMTIKTKADMIKSAEILSNCGPQAVLVKGGHFKGDHSDDLLYIKDRNIERWFQAKRVKTKNDHGTGCSLSSAIAAYLGKDKDIETAVKLSKEYITGAIDAAKDHEIGHGHGPLQHFWKYYNY